MIFMFHHAQRTAGKRFSRWLLQSIRPSPDLVILLDAPAEVLSKRRGGYSQQALDEQRQTFLSLQNKIPNMKIIDATGSANDVHRKVTALIWRHYGKLAFEGNTNGRIIKER